MTAERRAKLAGLLAGRHWVLDGALGTELECRGVPAPTPLWSTVALRERPEVVLDIHRAYVSAGADVLTAATFRTNPRALAAGGCLSEGRNLCEKAVRLARDATVTRPEVLVAASVAPVADCYRPDLAPTDDELRSEHALFAEWLAAARPDLLWIETMNTAREAAIAAAAAREWGLAFAVSYVLSERGTLLSGDDLGDAVEQVLPFEPLVLGVNCVPPRGVAAVIERLRRLTPLPLAAYAHINNAAPTAGWSYAQALDPEAYAAYARGWLAAGATLIGGCCGTTPAHIGALRRLLPRV